MPNPNIPNFTKTQLELRREANLRRLNGETTPHILTYQNGKTAWIRMSSSVDIVDADLANAMGVSTGNQLAKNKILQTGELYIDKDGKYSMRAGVGSQGGAYGDSSFGKRSDYGIVPMAGIVSLTIDGIAYFGGTRNATIKYKCWTKTELDALLLLYARVGCNVLIEWGWSQYFPNPTTDSIKSYKFEKLENRINYYNILDNTLIQEQIYRDIFDYTLDNQLREARKNDNLYPAGHKPKKLMEAHSGNYEAFFGMVKNFNWKESDTGGYEITTVAMGIGELINSTKVEYVSKLEPAKFLNIEAITPAQKLDFFVGKMNGTLSEIYNKSKETSDASKELFNNFYLPLTTLKELNSKKKIPIVTSRIPANKTSTFECYIRFQELVEIINQYMTLSINNNAPIIKISLQDETYDDMQCNAHYLQLSADNSICLIKQCDSENLCPKSMRYSYFDKSVVQADDVNFFVKDNKRYTRGLIKNIYLNVSYLKEVLTKSKTPSGVFLYDFLINVLKDVQVSLGSVNDFDLRVDSYSNHIRIFDKNCLVNDMTMAEYENVYKIDINGSTTVCRKYSLDSVIDSRTANAMVIATRGLQLGEVDNSELAILNFGTADRHLNATGEKTPKTSTTVEKVDVIQRAKNFTEAILQYVYSTKMTSLDRNNYNIGDVSESLKTLIQQENLLTQVETNGGEYYSKRTVPIRMNITIDGVAGLNVGQIFRISEDRLPIGYAYQKDKNFRHCFLITNVVHNIDANDWVTEIQATTCFVPTKDVGNVTKAKIFENTSLNDINSSEYKTLMSSYFK